MSGGPRVEALYPLTPSQTGMWLQAAAAGPQDRLVEQAAFCLEGRVDRDALTRALQCVVDRHGALRSTILAKGLQPLRAVLQEMRVPLREVAADGGEDAALTAVMTAERARGFSLNRPPLIRFALLSVNPERAWLVVTFHHIILDGWSLLTLWTEAAAFYAAELAGTTAQLRPAADEAVVAEWFRRRSDSESERFWRSRLAGFPGPTPIVNPVARAADEAAEQAEHIMSPAASEAVTAAARECRVSPAIVFDVLWALLLAGRTRRDDVMFAATVSGRPPGIPGIERVVGCFINTVPVRVRFDDGETVRTCLARHQERRAEQAEFEYCAAGQIHEWSGMPLGAPLCQSLLVFENLRGPGADAAADEAVNPNVEPAVTEGGRRVHGARTAYPVTLLISPGAATHLRLVHQPSLLSAAAARELMAGLEQLALALPAQLERPARAWRESIAYVPVEAPQGAAVERPPFVAPRTRLEHEITAIWEGLFKVAPIGVFDDFFSLGGHSLLVLQMAAKLRAVTGTELPLHVLVSATTIAGLARACAGNVNDHAALIPLSGEGDGRAIYCPHPLGGHVLCYAALGRRLSGRHRAWGLQAKGLAAGETPAASWDEVIDHHWSLLLESRRGDGAGAGRHAIDGVAFVGYSYGGYIALELAARARREGATDVRVVLLDVPHPSVIPAEQRRLDAATLLHALFGHSLGLALEDMRRVPVAELTRHVYDEAVARQLIPRETPFEQVERVLNVARAHSGLEPPLADYAFPVLLVRAREGADRVSSQLDFGWTPHVQGLTIEWVAGSHESMLEPNFAQDLAALVGNYVT